MLRLAVDLSARGSAFDVILDDGSHKVDEQLATLAALFPLVRPGGFYVIEDLGSSWNRHYGHNLFSMATPLAVLSHWLRTGELRAGSAGEALRRPVGACLECVYCAAANDGATCLLRKRQRATAAACDVVRGGK